MMWLPRRRRVVLLINAHRKKNSIGYGVDKEYWIVVYRGSNSVWGVLFGLAFFKYMPAVPVVNGVPWIRNSLSLSYLANHSPCPSGFLVVTAIGNTLARPDERRTSPMAHDVSNGNRCGKREEVIQFPKKAPEAMGDGRADTDHTLFHYRD